MKSELITNVDRVDDLAYNFYKEFDTSFLKEKPEYRFLLLSTMLEHLCEFNLCNNSSSINYLIKHIKSNKTFNTVNSDRICSIIKSVVGEATYFAASYWSPIDKKRHTVSHSVKKQGREIENESRAAALLFYLLTYKAPPKFHSAINFIATEAPNKDGLHSYYGDYDSILSPENNNSIWWHLPLTIHEELLLQSGFSKGIQQLLSFDSEIIIQSLTFLMENLDSEKIESEYVRYSSIYSPIVEAIDNFSIPKHLTNYAHEFHKFLNTFFNPDNQESKDILSINQAFFMACTHALYNKACPTKMFYTFPVRVADNCCVLTLGVTKELSVENTLAISHIVKSLFYHGVDRDYQALNALERNRIAHGAVHKIRGPLNLLKSFPYDLEETLKGELSQDEYSKIDNSLNKLKLRLRNSIENILIGVKSLENFIDIEQPVWFSITKTITNAINTYKLMDVKILEDIQLKSLISDEVLVYGVPSHVQFIFEELISNSIRAFKYNLKNSSDEQKLKIEIALSNDDINNFWIVNFTDNGIGVPASKKQSIFYSGTRGIDSGGSGKGLYISKLFLNNFGNDIIECGEFQNGVNFKISFRKKLSHEIKNINSGR